MRWTDYEAASVAEDFRALLRLGRCACYKLKREKLIQSPVRKGEDIDCSLAESEDSIHRMVKLLPLELHHYEPSCKSWKRRYCTVALILVVLLKADVATVMDSAYVQLSPTLALEHRPQELQVGSRTLLGASRRVVWYRRTFDVDLIALEMYSCR